MSLRWATLVGAFFLLLATACGDSGDLILATTTSTQDSGLLDVLVPLFERQTGYGVKTIAVGTGQALKMGERGEADVLLVHAPKAEEAFTAQGYGVNRRLVMHNDFVIVGPPEDPAGIRGLDSAAAAFQRLAQAHARFASRDDDSGTHKKEREIWAQLGIDPGQELSYIETGQGMGQTLLIADEKRSYTLSDRATYLAFRRHLDLEVLVEGDPSLRNIYHVMQVNPQKYPKVNAAGAKAFVDFITSPEIQGLIGSFGVAEYGQPLFVPDAHLEAGTPAAD